MRFNLKDPDYSIADVRKHFRYDPETGKLERYKFKKGEWRDAGSFRADGYCMISFQSRRVLAHRLIHFMMTERWPDALMDHRDGNTFDNKWENLRPATFAENAQNSRRATNNAGEKNVRFKDGKFHVTIKKGGETAFSSSFLSFDEARICAIRARDAIFGDFASHDSKRLD